MSTPHPPRRRDATENRAALLVAAVTVLAEDPYASVDTITKAAGLSRRAFYGHFEDRAALVTAVIAEGAERFNAIARDVTDDDPRTALAHLARRLWNEAQHVHAAVAVALDEGLARLTAQSLAPVRIRLLDICERGYDRDVLRRDIPPAVTVRLVEEAARGVITHLDPAQTRGHHLAERAVLSAAGLGWRQIDELIFEEEHA